MIPACYGVHPSGPDFAIIIGFGGVFSTYTHDIEDQIVYAGADIYTYDVDGFLTSRSIASGAYSGGATFDYSSRGELLSASLPNGDTVTYTHDPMGRRISKSVNSVVVEKYLWQDATTLLAVLDSTGNVVQRFEYADGRMPVAMASGGAIYYLAYDQVGSLRVVTDAAGTVVKRVDYDSFGNILSDSNPSFSVPFGFAGGLHDRDTGLVRFGARDYDPATGKWTAKDPIDFAGGDLNLWVYCDIVGKPSIQTNLYLYTSADPINIIDPLGLWGITIGGSSVGIDFTTTLYDSNTGWFPDRQTDIGVSTTLVGGGAQIYFDTGFKGTTPPEEKIYVSMGLSKYLGVTYDPELTTGSVNLGLGIGLPLSFSTSLEHFIDWLNEVSSPNDPCQ